MDVKHNEEVFKLENGEEVFLEFSKGESLRAKVISPYSSRGSGKEVLFDVEGYSSVLSVKGGRKHEVAILRGGGEDFGFVESVSKL